MILASIIAVVVISLALCWRNRHRGAGVTGVGSFRTRVKIIFLVLAVCGLCSKAVVHTHRHFNPPPPPIIGP
jgi:hypothetical protein